MLLLGRPQPWTICGDRHSIGDPGRAGPNQAAVLFYHACVTRLNRAELRVVADVRNGSTGALDKVNEKFVGLGFLNGAVNGNLDHFFPSTVLVATPSPVVNGRA